MRNSSIGKIILAPDSFKGNMSAADVGRAMQAGILNFSPEIETEIVPMADGGEGTVEAVAAALQGRLKACTVTGPLGSPVTAQYCLIPALKTAVMEMASASGLPLVPAKRLRPMQSTTFGTGEMIRDALNEGCRKIIIGIGGSATNDGGTGAAEALGVRFLDSDGNSVSRGAEGLIHIAAIDISQRDRRIEACEILVACDVSNPLYGPEGAAYVYAPQKGATETEVNLIDRGLRNLAKAAEDSLGFNIAHISGAGAAGGLGAGLVGFMGATLSSGITIIAELLNLEERMAGADLVITGEGKTDFQTAFGKVPAGVAEIAARQGIPVVCLSGALGRNVETLYGTGITALFSTANSDMSLEYAFRHSPELIRQSTENIVRIFAAGAALN